MIQKEGYNMHIIFCVPGKEFSRHFLISWSNLIQELDSMNVTWELICEYSPIVHRVRQQILEKALEKTYDYLMWLDSDMVFSISDFKKLLSHKDNCNIISGLYFAQSGGDLHNIPENFACLDINGSKMGRFDYGGEKLIQVRGNGMGFMLVKQGVFECIDKPFISNTNTRGEDIIFQLKAATKGFNSYVDPSIIIGHEKSYILK